MYRHPTFLFYRKSVEFFCRIFYRFSVESKTRKKKYGCGPYTCDNYSSVFFGLYNSINLYFSGSEKVGNFMFFILFRVFLRLFGCFLDFSEFFIFFQKLKKTLITRTTQIRWQIMSTTWAVPPI